MAGILSQCTQISNHHYVYFKYLKILPIIPQAKKYSNVIQCVINKNTNEIV